MHGWWNWKYRACPAERFLLNPYAGCSVGCFFCYSRALPGYHREAFLKDLVFVWVNFAEGLSRRLDKLYISPPGYLSPTSDPFQPVNLKYRIAEKVIRAFIERNLPILVVTKREISEEALSLLEKQRDSVFEVSLLALNEKLRRFLSPGGSTVKEILSSLEKASKRGIHTVLRLDPILPFINDKEDDIYALLKEAKERGVRHVVVSCLDIPLRIKRTVLSFLSRWDSSLPFKYDSLYKERVSNSIQASLTYRKELFSKVREIADSLSLTLSLCMEFTEDGKNLNEIYATSKNCEGKVMPISLRQGEKFLPLPCFNEGSCLTCFKPTCGVSALAMRGETKYLSYNDFRRMKVGERVGSLFGSCNFVDGN
ncbi:MAG: radical SAM protein [Synergistetes bacterium]|nr:radical SAM protein [Synergistota bacterium]